MVTEVIVHVAADGRTEVDPVPKTISLELIRDDNSSTVLTPRPVTLDCARHELHVPVKHDLSTPFYKSRGKCFVCVLVLMIFNVRFEKTFKDFLFKIFSDCLFFFISLFTVIIRDKKNLKINQLID